MSGGQQAVKWSVPVSTSPFAGLFAPLPSLKQGRNLVGNYKNVMGKNLGETLFCSGLRARRQLHKEQVFRVNMHSIDCENWLRVLGLAVSGSGTWCGGEGHEEERLR